MIGFAQLIDLYISNGMASHFCFAPDRIPLAMQSSIRRSPSPWIALSVIVTEPYASDRISLGLRVSVVRPCGLDRHVRAQFH